MSIHIDIHKKEVPMNKGAFVDIMVEWATKFPSTDAYRRFLEENRGRPMDDKLIESLIDSFGTLVDTSTGLKKTGLCTGEYKQEFLPKAIAFARSCPEKPIVNQKWILATIVAFTKLACYPINPMF